MRIQALVVLAATVSCVGRLGAAWTTHTDPLGFKVDTPAGWQAAGDSQSGRVVVTGTAREQVVIWPVFAATAVDPRAAQAMLVRLTAAAGVNAQWDAPQVLAGRAVRMTGRWGDRMAVASFAWTVTAKGTAGYLFVTAAPAAAYRGEQDTLTRVLESFRATGAPAQGGANAAAGVQWVKWSDPKENAFTLDVPAGWKADGGLFRFASIDTRPAWQVVSPDGQIRITGGDSQVPGFSEPNQMLAMAGMREGSWYPLGYGVNLLVRRYLPGTVFVREYVTTGAAKVCTGLAITDNRDRSDADQAINAINRKYAGMGFLTEVHSGDISFTCDQQGRAMAGYYFASTLRTRTAGMPSGLWYVQNLYGYLAPRDQARRALALGTHIVQSQQTNPQWAQMQQGITANTSHIVSETQSAVSNIISDSYWSRQKTMDEISRRRENAILGVEDVVDPATGERLKVESGSNYYWLDNRGAIVGTQTDTRPNLDFRALTRLP